VAEKQGDGSYFYRLLTGTDSFKKFKTDKEKLAVVLSSPALLKIISFECDLFSRGQISVKRDGEELPDDPIIKLFNRPNPFQNGRQFLWDFRFWNMLGCAYAYPSSKVVTDKTRMYWLNNANMEWDHKLLQKLDRPYLSEKAVDNLLKETFKYRHADNTSEKIPLGSIKAFPDLTNGLGNWYGSPSRLDALYKIIANSEMALDSKQINLKFTQKFLVGGDKDSLRTELHGTLTNGEKKSIEDSMNDNKQVKSVSSIIAIQRFVSDMAKLKLDDAYDASFNRMASMFGIPRELWDSIKEGGTYENQEKAIGRHVSYSVQAKSDDLANGTEDLFGYTSEKKEICFSYDHLPSMQVFEQERAERNHKNIETLRELVALGADVNAVAPDYGFDYIFTPKDTEDEEAVER
tara:strand:+ start:7214 stop:8428 length:1215 start_codon:yes stop_codon:yes gene_type:complete